jgi:hypothetical protein
MEIPSRQVPGDTENIIRSLSLADGVLVNIWTDHYQTTKYREPVPVNRLIVCSLQATIRIIRQIHRRQRSASPESSVPITCNWHGYRIHSWNRVWSTHEQVPLSKTLHSDWMKYMCSKWTWLRASSYCGVRATLSVRNSARTPAIGLKVFRRLRRPLHVDAALSPLITRMLSEDIQRPIQNRNITCRYVRF